MTRDDLIHAISDLARDRLVQGFYVRDDVSEAETFGDNPDFCRAHAIIVAAWHERETGVYTFIDSTSMGSDGHRECAFGGCGLHLDFGGLTDYGIESALGLTEPKPHEVSCYPSELDLAERALGPNDKRWELWEHHAKATIAWERRRNRRAA